MTEEQIQQAARAFEKAKGGDGPQRMADWAAVYGPALLALTAGADPFPQLRALFPNVADIDAHAAADIRARRADAAKRSGEPLQIELVGGDALQQIRTQIDQFVEALQPFGVMGAPATLEALNAAAESAGVDWDGEEIFAVLDAEGDKIASVSRAACIRAHELINEA